MKKMNILAAVLALVLVACAGVDSANAYFTTFAEAEGGKVLQLGGRTEIHEEFYDWTKHVTIYNEPTAQPVYVRARAEGPDIYPLVYSGEGWRDGGDGWWYYDKILYGGDTTPELLVSITGVPEDSSLLRDGYSFQVVVHYEAVVVKYDSNRNPYADWEGGGD